MNPYDVHDIILTYLYSFFKNKKNRNIQTGSMATYGFYEKIHKIIIDSSNLMSILSLNSLYVVTQNQLQSCHDEMEALYDLLGNYIKEMTALVGAGEGVTQVNHKK